MNTYIVNNTLSYKIVKAENSTEALVNSLINNGKIDQVFYTKENLQKQLLKMGFKNMMPTKQKEVFKLERIK